ncbi:LysE family translocator [Halopseudomonas sp.]|uniref:LysE family translocator n=1 Tax=Halopseudomonas sp. TaxID=2901191 RepID=UPI003001A52A
MNTELLLALVLFSTVASITPGPNNLMLLTSGVNVGFQRTLPHLAGVWIGFFVMLLAVGSGLGEVFQRWPALYEWLKWCGAAYLLYLAWRVATAAAPTPTEAALGAQRVMGFWGAVAFQWINPKAWVMAVSAFSLYLVPGGGLLAVFLIALVIALINLPCVSLWAFCGAQLRGFLQRPRNLRLFNGVMASLLVLSLVPLAL